MTIEIRLRHVLLLLVVALATIAACGQVHKQANVDANGGGDVCVWDQSTWDNCTLQ